MKVTVIALCVFVLAGCGASAESTSTQYSQEMNKEMPKPKDDTPLFDPPPNVLGRDGEAKTPKGGG